MHQTLTISKALADETRLRAVMALREGELCLCQLIDLFGLAPSTVSKHMGLLQQAGLVIRRKEGRWHYYRLVDRTGSPIARRALKWVTASLAERESIVADRKRLKQVVRRPLEVLSACYRT